MSFDVLFHREYDYERYNCLHFTVEAWQVLFDIDLSFLTRAFVQEGTMHSLSAISKLKAFKRLRRPQSPCVCLMRGVAPDQTHVATFLDGRVLHINELGVQYFPPEVIFFPYRQVMFYEYCCDH